MRSRCGSGLSVILFSLAAAFGMALAPPPAEAAIRIWDGGGGAANKKWQTPANWIGNIAPSPGDALVFPDGAPLSTENDFPDGTEFASIAFADDYDVSGNRIAIVSAIDVSGPDNVLVSCPITLKGALIGTTHISLDVSGGGRLTLTGIINDTLTATLHKIGAGAAVLRGANTFNAAVQVEEGALYANNLAGLGSASHGTTVAPGASLNFAPASGGLIDEPLTLTGEGSGVASAATLAISTPGMAFGGTVTLAGAVPSTILVSPGMTTGANGAFSGTTGFIVDGGGTLMLAGSATNTFAGAVIVKNGGLLAVRTSLSIPAGLIVGDGAGGAGTDSVSFTASNQIAGPLTVTPSGSVSLADSSQTVSGLTMTGGSINTNMLGALVLNGDVTVNLTPGAATALIQGRLLLGNGTRTFTIAGSTSPALNVTATISGGPGAGLNKQGTGSLRLAGANSYSGLTMVDAGKVIAGSASAFGAASAGTIVPAGSGMVVLETAVPNEPLTAAGDVDTIDTALACESVSLCTWGGPIAIQGRVEFSAAAGTILRLDGSITGPSQFFATGAGIVELGGSNAYTGKTNIFGGTLRLNASHRLPDTTVVTFGSTGTLDLNGFTDTIAMLSSTSASPNVLLGSGSLIVAPAADVSGTFNGVISGSGSLVKSGDGLFELKNTQTYTGVTGVQGGTLRLNGATLAGPVSINSGARLDGKGTMGALSATSGTVAPGVASGGVFTTGALTLGASATLEIDIDGEAPGSYGQLAVTGAVTLGTATLALDASPSLSMASLGPVIIVSNDGTDPVAGTFNGLDEGATITSHGKSLRVTYKGGDGNDVALEPAVREYYLSEGATGPFFDLDVLIANPNASDAPATLTFLLPGGGTVVQSRTIPAMSRATVHVDDIAGLESTAVSTVVSSGTGLPLIVERTMRWDASGYGAHTEKAAGGTATDWYFAEGAQGFFSMYLLLANPQMTENSATVTYLREGTTPIVRTYSIKPQSRFTVDASADPELVTQSFGMHVTFAQPGVAERSMYFGRDPLWQGGHESAGVTDTSTSWFLAEGATGSFFETFVLLANPTDAPANAEVTFLPSTGVPVKKTRTIPAFGRVTINIENEDPSLKNAAVATQVTSDTGILVERAQYWPGNAWYEAHNSFGVTETGTKWGLAEGRKGGAEAYHTYILIANPGNTAASVTVTFLRENGAPFDKTFTVQPTSRFNVDTVVDVPELPDGNFGAIVVSSQPVVVERAMYSSANGQVWAAGTNATATALP